MDNHENDLSHVRSNFWIVATVGFEAPNLEYCINKW